MALKENIFENQTFNPFENNIFEDNVNPDNNLLDEEAFLSINAQYVSVDEAKGQLSTCTDSSVFSILHVNIRSMSKNFEKLKLMLHECNHLFGIICLTETWCSDETFRNDSNLHLPQYDSIHLERIGKRGGGVCVFVHKKLMCKYRKDFSVSEDSNETVSIEIINKNSKNIIVNCCYRPPNGKITPFKKHIHDILNKLLKENKKIFFVGDFNINSLDYSTNTKVKRFVDLMFSNGMISVINKPTRVAKNSVTCIDHIYTNSFVNYEILAGIIETDLSDHFPVFIVDKNIKATNYPDKIEKEIRVIDNDSIIKFKTILNETDWMVVLNTHDPNLAYDVFMKQFVKIYDKCFPSKKVTIKRKSLLSPWITKGLAKSSKQKQKLYIKYLKSKTFNNEQKYKSYKNLFERIKFKSKQNYFASRLKKHQYNARETWKVIKEATGRTKSLDDTFPRKIIIDNEEIFHKEKIANEFNNYFVNVGSNLAAKIPNSEKHFSDYMDKSNDILNMTNLTEKEFLEAFQSIKINKAPGFDEISPNVIKASYEELYTPLFHICNISIKYGCFPDKMKIAKVKPLFKANEKELVSNYRPISILPVLSKLLERIMYNKVYNHVVNNQLLYNKQFSFQKQVSTEYAIVQLTREILDSFDKNQFTLGVFIDLSKAFDTVNHEILLSKLRYFGIEGTYLKWFQSYLHNRKQFITFGNNKKSDLLPINCGVPQGSILGPLLFLLYVNDLQKASDILKPLMFADDTNLFYSHKNIRELFKTMNKELINIQQWFNANKLSLNATKTKYSFFHSLAFQDRIPLQLPKLEINNVRIKREQIMRFLGVLLDENMTWKNHISSIESKVSKNLGVLYKARRLLNKKCLKQIYFSCIHSYLNYGNISWASTNKTKLKTLLRRQKHGARIINLQDRLTHAKPLLQELKALNIYQLNIFQTLLFMHKVKNDNIPDVFKNSFMIITNKYNTKAANTTFYKPFCRTKTSQYSIIFRGPHLWNSLIPVDVQSIPYSTFKTKIKTTCLFLEHEENFF